MTQPSGSTRVLGQQLATICDDEVALACQLVDMMCTLTDVQDTITRSIGRKRGLTVRALFVGLLLTAVHDRTAVIRRVHETLHYRISDEAREQLGVPRRPRTQSASNAGYRAVLRLFHTTVAAMDPSSMRRTRELVPRTEPQPRRKMTAAERDRNVERLLRVVNDLLEQTFQQLPAEVRDQWHGDLGVDATPIAAYSRGRTRRSHWWPSEVDGGWYVREGDHRDDDSTPDGQRKRKKFIYGFEATLAVIGSRHASWDSVFPRLVLGMTMHKPGHAPGPNALRVLRDLARRGHPAGFIGADRNYNNADPATLQLPARALGYKWLFDYRDDQLGIQATTSGAIQVGGAWYCPSMPAPLIEATKLYRNGLIDEATYEARITARAAYLMRPKAAHDDEGHQRLMCPADGCRGCTALCDHKPKPSGWQAPHPLTRVLPMATPAGPPKVCTQTSITVPPSDGAKHAQDLRYATPEWRNGYRTLRNAIEGGNGYIKRGDGHGLADASRRRVRGIAAQTLLCGFLIAASNLEAIRNWLDHAEVEDGHLRVRKRRRKTRPLSDYNGPDATAA